VRKGEHGMKVYFVEQLQIKDDDQKEAETRLVPLLREYPRPRTTFGVWLLPSRPQSRPRSGAPKMARSQPLTIQAMQAYQAEPK
jgi:hypothetical protein